MLWLDYLPEIHGIHNADRHQHPSILHLALLDSDDPSVAFQVRVDLHSRQHAVHALLLSPQWLVGSCQASVQCFPHSIHSRLSGLYVPHNLLCSHSTIVYPRYFLLHHPNNMSGFICCFLSPWWNQWTTNAFQEHNRNLNKA